MKISRDSRLHIAEGAEFLHGGDRFLVLGAAGALGDLGRLQFFDDLVDRVGFGLHRSAAGYAADGPEALAVFG